MSEQSEFEKQIWEGYTSTHPLASSFLVVDAEFARGIQKELSVYKQALEGIEQLNITESVMAPDMSKRALDKFRVLENEKSDTQKD